MLQSKQQDKTSEKEQNKMDIGSLPTSVKVIKMLAELKRRMDEHSETANREMENIRKQQKEVIWTEKLKKLRTYNLPILLQNLYSKSIKY